MRFSGALAIIIAWGCGGRPARTTNQWGGASVPGGMPGTVWGGDMSPSAPSPIPTLLLDSSAPTWWGHSADGARIVMQVDRRFILLRASDFAVLGQVDSAMEPDNTNCPSPRVFSAATGLLAWLTTQGSLRLWNITVSDAPQTLAINRAAYCSKLAFASDGRQLVLADYTGLLSFDTQQPRERWSSQRPAAKLPRNFAPPGNPGVPTVLEFFADTRRLRAAWSFMGMSIFAADSGKRIAGPYGRWNAEWSAPRWVSDSGDGERTGEAGKPNADDWMLSGAEGKLEYVSLQTLKVRRLNLDACASDFQPMFALSKTLLGCTASSARLRVVDLEKDKVVADLKLDNEPTCDSAYYQSSPEVGEHPYASDPRLTPDGHGVLVSLQHWGNSPEPDPHTWLFGIPGGQMVADLGCAAPLGRAVDGRLFFVDLRAKQIIAIGAGLSVHRFLLPLTVGGGHISSNASNMHQVARVSHSGALIVTADDRRGYLVNTITGNVTLLEVAPIEPSDSTLTAVSFIEFSFAADDTRLYGLSERAATVWELPSGRPLFRVRGKTALVRSE